MVGGLDEQELAIAYNDIDFCLRLRAPDIGTCTAGRITRCTTN